AFVGPGHADLQLDAGVAQDETLQWLGDQVGDEALADRQAHLALAQPLQGRQTRQHALFVGPLLAVVRHQQFAGLGRRHALRGAFQEAHAEMFLQAGELPADGRGVDVQV
ncbi:hypothetical protein SC81_22695, partial [Vibrio vulnificus]